MASSRLRAGGDEAEAAWMVPIAYRYSTGTAKKLTGKLRCEYLFKPQREQGVRLTSEYSVPSHGKAGFVSR